MQIARAAAHNADPTTGNASTTDAMGALAKGKGLEASADAHAQRQAQEILWPWVVFFGALHVAALYGAFLLFASARLLTIAYTALLFAAGGVGVTAGAHRLWCHRCYKATRPLRVLLVVMNTLAFQNHIHEWARDHRLHHKYTETDADPHNSTRGFFFSHVGWLLMRKHPHAQERAKLVDVSDIEQDEIVTFQKK
ncbi:hypothetical protein R5R35_010174 [Gryllus longicercus]